MVFMILIGKVRGLTPYHKKKKKDKGLDLGL